MFRSGEIGVEVGFTTSICGSVLQFWGNFLYLFFLFFVWWYLYNRCWYPLSRLMFPDVLSTDPFEWLQRDVLIRHMKFWNHMIHLSICIGCTVLFLESHVRLYLAHVFFNSLRYHGCNLFCDWIYFPRVSFFYYLYVLPFFTFLATFYSCLQLVVILDYWVCILPPWFICIWTEDAKSMIRCPLTMR